MSDQKLKELLTEEDAKRERFHKKLTMLRERNIELSEKQAELRKQRKPSRGLVNKDRRTAIEITVLLRLMRKVKRLSLKYQPPCRLCGHIDGKTPEREIHALPKDPTEKILAERTEYEIVHELALEEFIN
jgi:hypothetical protein